jgi:hypothetical protein
MNVYAVVTNKGYWGKGHNLFEAFKNAKLGYGDMVVIAIVQTEDYDSVFVDNWGAIIYNTTDNFIWVTEKATEFSNFVPADEMLTYLIEALPDNDPESLKLSDRLWKCYKMLPEETIY